MDLIMSKTSLTSAGYADGVGMKGMDDHKDEYKTQMGPPPASLMSPKRNKLQMHSRSTGGHSEGFVGKIFNNVKFAEVDDRFNVIVEYDRNSELLQLKFTNLTTKDVFKQDFDQDAIQKITDGCKLQPDLVVKMMIDTLKSKELTAENIRIFMFPNLKYATAKFDEVRSMKRIPDPTPLPSGSHCHSTISSGSSGSASLHHADHDMTENSGEESSLLFVLHFDAPPYISFNYCFIVRGMYVSEYDRLGMRIRDLEKENKNLRDLTKVNQHSIQQLIHRVDHLSEINGVLTQRFLLQEIDEKVDTGKSNESSQTVEEIELSLRNNWVRYDESWSVPKAFKIGPVVYLNGLIKDGTKGHIATLPKGWRPRKQKMFAQCSNGSTTRVDVLADGRIFLFVTQFQSFLSLEGMAFVIQ